MDGQKKFIVTTSEASAKELASLGFRKVAESSRKWIFLNDSKLKFSNLGQTVATDRLSF